MTWALMNPIRDDIQRAMSTPPSRWSAHTILIVASMIVVIVTALVAAIASRSLADAAGMVGSVIVGLALSSVGQRTG